MESNEGFYIKYEKKVMKNIRHIMHEHGITQKILAENSGINQSTLSKLLSGKASFTLEHIAKIARALNIDAADLVSFRPGTVITNTCFSSHYIPENDNLVCSINRPAFKGYIGNKYYLYFYSTISSEAKLIHGELTLSASDENRCRVNLEIYTGKIDVSGTPIRKVYTGDMVISISMGSCYCTLTNAEIGELCFLSFHHMFLFSQDILCRIGAVLTTSSGGNRRPTLHRMVISKYEFNLDEDSEDLHFLKGQLKLNSSRVLISKKEFQALLKKYASDSDVSLKKFFSSFQNLAEQEEYYEIEESTLLGINIPVGTKINGISLLREASTSDKYNKISSKCDEFLFEYISSRTKD